MNPTDNLLLAALPTEEREQLLKLMHLVTLDVGFVAYEQDAPVSEVYFPLSGALSILILLEDGRAVEPALIGREGMLGFPIGLGKNLSPWQSIVQLPGQALVMPRDALRDFISQPGHLAPLLQHFAGLLIGLAAQSVACTQFHSIEQRTARWLLIMRSRADRDEFAITQEWLAHMLGVHRPSETLALSTLRERGLIEQSRGRIRISDQAGLEALACECAARSARQYAELVEVAAAANKSGGDPYRGDDGQPGTRDQMATVPQRS